MDSLNFNLNKTKLNISLTENEMNLILLALETYQGKAFEFEIKNLKNDFCSIPEKIVIKSESIEKITSPPKKRKKINNVKTAV